MTDQPKVSERMEALLLEVVMDGRAHERNGDRYTLADYKESKASLLSAIAEIEQRAEKFESDLERLHSGLCCAWNLEYPSSDDTLLGFASGLFDRVEKWKRVAVAIYKGNRASAEYRKAQLRGLDYLSAYEEAWEKSDLEFAESIAALGDEWDEAVKKGG